MAPNRGFKDFSIPYYPWAYFLIFLVSNTVLSYFPTSLESKLWLGLLGLLVPFIFAALEPIHPAKNVPFLRETFQPPPHWVWMLMVVTAFTRLWGLTSLSAWPTPDEGCYSLFALNLTQNWSWSIFSGYWLILPIPLWSLSFFYRFFTPSLFSLWFYPALISILIVAFVYFSARRIFPKSFAFLLVAMSAVSFPLLYTGRFCMGSVVMIFWEVLVFGLLGSCFERIGHPGETRSAFLLGTLTGLGFFTGLSWPVVALAVLIGAFYLYRSSSRMKNFWIFLCPFSLFSCLFISASWAMLTQGSRLGGLLALGPADQWSVRLFDALGSLVPLCWFSSSPYAYGPLWGGMLNPIMGSFFLWGLVECVRYRRRFVAYYALASLFLFLIPGLMARGDDEVFRYTQVFLLLILISALGFQSLLGGLENLKNGRRFMTAILFLGLSGSLDFYHLNVPYHALWGTFNPYTRILKSLNHWRTYELLEKISHDEGAGSVLADLQPNFSDYTLATAVFPFDAARNPRILPEKVKWVAIIVNVNYVPFLSTRFPQCQWFDLERNLPQTAQSQMLGVIPLNLSTRSILTQWIEADQKFQSVTTAMMYHPAQQSLKPITDKILENYPFFRGDPFLESCFWEKVAFQCVGTGDKPAALHAIDRGLKYGYPLPQLISYRKILLKRIADGKE